MPDRDDQKPLPRYRNPDAGLTDLIQQSHALSRPLAGVIRYGEADEETGEVDEREIEVGADVLSHDGEKLGEVVNVIDDYLVVEQGFFNPHDVYIPISAIDRHGDDCLYLRMTRDEFEASDWTGEPAPNASDVANGQDTDRAR
ncbi:MAG: PRC-barrel domain-containing protein [Chloroflexota bacterium]|nr:PRC-barrel domain-containing protein [Chloroflexota bacterium]